MFALLTSIFTWRPIPLIGHPPTDPYQIHFIFWVKSAIYWITHGKAFSGPVNWYWERVGTMAFGAVKGRLILDAVMGFLGGGWIAWMALIPRDRQIHVAGMTNQKGDEAVKASRAITKANNKTNSVFMHLHPDLGLHKKMWTRHFLIYGGVGSGKTVIQMQILDQIFKKNLKAIIYDIKGDFTAKYGRALIVSPWDQRSVIWDIAQDISTESAIRSFANSLYPSQPGDDNAFFAQASASILIALIKSLYKDFNGSWGWKELEQRINLPQSKLHSYMTQFEPGQAKVIESAESKTTDSVLGTFASGALVISQLAQAWGDERGEKRLRLSLRKWLRDDYQGSRQIILQGGKDVALQSAYIAAMINSLVPEIISPAFPDNEMGRSIFFMIDELPTVGKINIEPIAALGRSKGVILIAGFQDISQVKKIYGEEFAKSLPAMTGTHIVCQLGPGETRQQAAQQIGKRRVGVMQNNYSYSNGSQTMSSTYQEQERDLFLETQLTTDLGVSARWAGVRALYRHGEHLLMLDFPFKNRPDERASFVEADWCRSLIREERSHKPTGFTAKHLPGAPKKIETKNDPQTQREGLSLKKGEAQATPSIVQNSRSTIDAKTTQTQAEKTENVLLDSKKPTEFVAKVTVRPSVPQPMSPIENEGDEEDPFEVVGQEMAHEMMGPIGGLFHVLEGVDEMMSKAPKDNGPVHEITFGPKE